MQVFLTGGTGFIGYHLIEELLARNWKIKSLARPTSNIPDKHRDEVDFVIGDLLQPASLQGIMDDADLVIHMAGLIKGTSFAPFKKVNLEGTKNLLEAVENSTGASPKFIFVSSMAAAGPSQNKVPSRETDPDNPVSWYGKSKLLAEKEVKNSNLDYTIIRPAAVYGPGDKETLIFFQLAKYHIIPKIGGETRYLSLIHVKDLVDLILKAGINNSANNQTYNGADTQEGYSWSNMIETAAKGLSTWTTSIYLPKSMVSLGAHLSTMIAKLSNQTPMFTEDKYKEMVQKYWLFSSEKAQNELDFQPKYTLNQGFKETINWYQKQGWI